MLRDERRRLQDSSRCTARQVSASRARARAVDADARAEVAVAPAAIRSAARAICCDSSTAAVAWFFIRRIVSLMRARSMLHPVVWRLEGGEASMRYSMEPIGRSWSRARATGR
jgi:hypothetical protein